MMDIDEITAIVIDECIAIHRELGPGLFETVYETVLAGRLEKRGLSVARQVAVPLNFSQATMKDGIRRLVNDYKPQ